MKKVIRLTESDLTSLVKKVIKEGKGVGCYSGDFQNPHFAQNPIVKVTLDDMSKKVYFTFRNGHQCYFEG